MARKYDDLTREQLIALLKTRDGRRFSLIWESDESVIGVDRSRNSDFVTLNSKPDNVRLVDPKRAINNDLNAKVKTAVEHQAYGRTAILFLEDKKRWMTVRYDETKDKNELDSVFRLPAMVDF